MSMKIIMTFGAIRRLWMSVANLTTLRLMRLRMFCTHSTAKRTQSGAATSTVIYNQITTADAVIALQMAVRGEHSDDADANGDGLVTSLDALMILQAAVGCTYRSVMFKCHGNRTADLLI